MKRLFSFILALVIALLAFASCDGTQAIHYKLDSSEIKSELVKELEESYAPGTEVTVLIGTITETNQYLWVNDKKLNPTDRDLVHTTFTFVMPDCGVKLKTEQKSVDIPEAPSFVDTEPFIVADELSDEGKLDKLIDLAWNEAQLTAATAGITIEKDSYNLRHDINVETIWIQFYGRTDSGWDDRSVNVTLVRGDDDEYSISDGGVNIVSQTALTENTMLQTIKQRIEYIESDVEANPEKYKNGIPTDSKQYQDLIIYDTDLILKYIFSEYLEGGQTGSHDFVMWKVMMYLLNDNESISYDAENGQDYFNHWLKSAHSVQTQHDVSWLEENTPAIALVLSMTNTVLTETDIERIALEHCKHNYDYIETTYNADQERWQVEFWENSAKVAAQKVMLDKEGNLVGTWFAE